VSDATSDLPLPPRRLVSMTDELPKRLTPAEAQAKAEECRALAKVALDQSHRIMLISIAHTWERIAADTRWNQ
jgi:hypothetical protein